MLIMKRTDRFLKRHVAGVPVSFAEAEKDQEKEAGHHEAVDAGGREDHEGQKQGVGKKEDPRKDESRAGIPACRADAQSRKGSGAVPPHGDASQLCILKEGAACSDTYFKTVPQTNPETEDKGEDAQEKGEHKDIR